MIRIVRTARLRAVERQVADAQARLAEVRAGADRALARHMAELLAAAERQRAAEVTASSEGYRADIAEGQAKELREENTQLVAELRALEETPLTVFITLYNGRVHSVHATEEAAQAAAENDPTDPAPPAPWGAWVPVPAEGPRPKWIMRRASVHGLLNGVHAPAAGVHDAPEGVHSGDAGGGERG
ncbi:hypothetical protein [Streptomyces sp. NBRC 109706]|uniref:hypothetical protein n=1 Tax=Streptomyces sp. NBRC 109706 TaxID=1550035 RepID=UPI000780F2C2|nr:hypothetical protein [Streptomyces sp. NBRC 109706]